MNNLQDMVIKVPYTYMRVYNQSSKKGSTLSNLNRFSYGPAVHLISSKTFVSHLHWLRLLAQEEWKRLNGVTSHGL